MTFDPATIKPYADLRGANLRGANLRGADLYRADLRGADLQGANLRGADLYRADLQGVILQRANLQEANLQGANLHEADLQEANLQGANLHEADLQGAILPGANLRGANLHEADLENVKGLHYQIPQEGALVVWKALAEGIVAKIQIPPRAKRTASIVGRKCRAEYVEVLEIIGGNGESGSGLHDGTEYKVGKIVRPDRYDDDPRVECTHGIHFFLTREEAKEYVT